MMRYELKNSTASLTPKSGKRTQILRIYAVFFTGLTRFAGLTGFAGLTIMRKLGKNPKDFFIRENS
jgi:hypothetical protein